MTQNVIVLSVSRYQIADDSGKTTAEGTSVRYLMADELTHKENEQRTAKGFAPAKCNLPYGAYEKFSTVPGLYSTELSYSVDSKGVAKITPSEFTLISPLNLAGSKGLGKSTGGFPATK